MSILDNQKHLSLDNHKYIKRSLNQGLSFKEKTKYLGKDPTYHLQKEQNQLSQRLVS